MVLWDSQPRHQMRAQRQRTAAVALILLACCPRASASSPSLDINQYAHTAWKVRDGSFKGTIVATAQTPDGYLWFGTEFGLLRFDGVRSVPWQPPAGSALPDDHIRTLLAARDGTLWIGTWSGLASWKSDKLVAYPGLDGTYIHALFEDREGTIWVGAQTPSTGLLCAIRGGKTECHGDDGSLGPFISSLYEDRSGVLWVCGADRIWR